MSFGRSWNFLSLSFFFALVFASGAELQAACTVNNTDDSGAGSLRQAITDANANNCGGLIDFNLGAGNPTINVGATTSSPLPVITNAVTIDGNTGGATRVVLDGTSAGAGADGFSISGGGNVTLHGFVICKFSNNGIRISNSDGNTIQGNFIGTNPTGTVTQPNTQTGIFLLNGASDNLIGGTSAADRNLVSGNGFCGITIGTGSLQNGSANVVQGNFIGTDINGTAAIGNDCGINISGEAGNQIGGSAPGAGNLISGNRATSGGAAGIRIFNMTATGNIVEGNKIGVSLNGGNLGNGGDGVTLGQGSSDNTIGGTANGANNIIAFNLRHGVEIDSGTGNAILGNSIFSNMNLGIDLGFDFTPNANDNEDPDTGANNLQNFPELASTFSANGMTNVQGTFNSTPSSNFRLEFFANNACDGSGSGEGQTFLGFVDVMTDGSGNAAFNTDLAATLTGTKFITATATNSANNDTSEFSECLQATILVEDCTNGNDDDDDGLVDCDDPSCSADPACAPAGVEVCNNGTDDDGDGLVDCDDPDCSLACTVSFSGSGGCALGTKSGSVGTAIIMLLPLSGILALWLKKRNG